MRLNPKTLNSQEDYECTRNWTSITSIKRLHPLHQPDFATSTSGVSWHLYTPFKMQVMGLNPKPQTKI